MGNAAGDQPDLCELLSRMQAIRSSWDWRENPDPCALGGGAFLASLNQQGIWNRATLVSAERSPYTRGLECELPSLQSVEEDKYRRSVLPFLLTAKTIDSPPTD